MKFKDLKDDEEKLEFFKTTYKDKSIPYDNRIDILRELTGKSERTVRKWASEKLGLGERVEIESPEFKKAKGRVFDPTKKRFIITWAQNNTPIHERFLINLKAYAKQINADIHVIAGRYKNPTSVFTDKEFERWDPRVNEFLDANRHDIHKYLSIMSDIKIQPTAVNPMTGMAGISGINSCVFGGPKIQMEMIPVLEGCKPKMMVTTGACTVDNYTDSKAGKKGQFHHQIGFTVVEIADDETFYLRQVSADDDGDFTDLCFKTTFKGKKVECPVVGDIITMTKWIKKHHGDRFVWKGKSKVKKIDEIEGIVLGDLHCGHHDQEVLDKTLEFMDKLPPKHVVLHDVFDGRSISHHEMKDPFRQYQKELTNENDLELELDEMMETLKAFEKYKNVLIVRSNHDDFLDRWLKNEDWKKQPTAKNSLLYMELSAKLLKQYARNDVKGVIPELINEKFPHFTTTGRSASYKVKGWELAQHGDVGSNGSRGSLNQFRKLNTKIIVGHYHSPGRKDNVMAVGTTTHLRVGYNQGPSSWLQSHVIIHKDGKVQHINFVNGGFTTLM
jgi:hypothetical protein